MSTPQIGDVLGQHRIDSILGEGGFGKVYGARDLHTQARVAVKVLKPDDGSSYLPTTRGRFEREVVLVSRLRSENTVGLLGHGETPAGLLYMVFEYLPGEDLIDALARHGRVSPEVVAHVLRQLLASLAEAHRAGLLHRDIKPQNVRVVPTTDDPWRVKLLDFGIARPTDHSLPGLTKTGELIGTPRYMSPEQLTDRPLSPASDIYSLGVLGFEMLSGSGALPGNNWGDQLERLRTGYLFSVDAAPRAEKLVAVLQRMTERDVTRRFATAEAVLTALDGGNVTVEAPDRPRRWFAGIALAIVALGSFVALVLREPPQPTVVTLPKPPTPPTPQDPANPAAGNELRSNCRRRSGRQGDLSCTTPKRAHDLARPNGSGRQSWAAYLPEDWSGVTPLPLVMLFHGKGHDAGRWLEISGFPEIAEREQFIVVAPSDPALLTQDPWEEDGDAARAYEIYEATADLLCVDRDRVFTMGHEKGSYVAVRLGCEDWVRAVATNSSRNRFVFCAERVPRLALTPRDSPRLPLEGTENCRGFDKASLEQLLRHLRRRHACGQKAEEAFEHPNGTCDRWLGCEAALQTCVLEGGDPWPGMPVPLPGTGCDSRGPDFPIAERVWAFFDEVAPREPQ